MNILPRDDLHDDDPGAETDADEIAAIQEALDDLEAGDEEIPFEEFDRDFRERHRLA